MLLVYGDMTVLAAMDLDTCLGELLDSYGNYQFKTYQFLIYTVIYILRFFAYWCTFKSIYSLLYYNKIRLCVRRTVCCVSQWLDYSKFPISSGAKSTISSARRLGLSDKNTFIKSSWFLPGDSYPCIVFSILWFSCWLVLLSRLKLQLWVGLFQHWNPAGNFWLIFPYWSQVVR